MIVKIHYGLGNQLYQYALGRSLEIKLNYKLYLDTTFYKKKLSKHPRVYLLDKFNIQAEQASQPDIDKYVSPSFMVRQYRGFQKKILPFYKQKIVSDNNCPYDANIFKIKEDTYLFGYWHDARYFNDISDVLRRELTFKTIADEKNQAFLNEINNCASVSIHIRRGDYLYDPAIPRAFVDMMDYYYLAVEQVARQVAAPVFYIFSDEPEWVRANFLIDHPCVYVDHNSEVDAHEDLRLMSNCKHHIIANSSFSWWGAWLNYTPDKIVIMPTKEMLYVPEGWTVLKT